LRQFVIRLASVSIAVLAYFAGVVDCRAQSSPAKPKPGVTNTYWITSKLIRTTRHNQTRQVVVYTPPGYYDPANAQTRYPVVYLLHGAPGNPTNFVKFGKWDSYTNQLIDDDKIAPAIWVAPDGNYVGDPHGDSEWVNSVDGRDLFEDFVANDIVLWTDQHFRTIPTAQARIIGGVSEGGYGAVNIALHRPKVFGMVLALSGYYTNDGSGWARPIMGHDVAFLTSNSPLDYIVDIPASANSPLKGMKFYLGAGDNEKHYADQTRQMATALSARGVNETTDFQPGKHGWILWGRLFADGLMALLPGPQEQAPDSDIYSNVSQP